MGYGNKIYEQAKREMDERRHRAEQLAQKNLDAFYAQCPEAQEIKAAMARNSAQVARTVFSGGDVRENLEKLKQNAEEYREEYDRLLSLHHVSKESVEPQYACTDCKDTGFLDGKLCHCFLQLERSIAYKNLSMSVPLERSRFDNFSLELYRNDPRAYEQMTRVFKTCQKYVETFRPNSHSLLFKGSTGLGKTHLSLAIAGEVIQKGFGVIYSSSQSLAAALEKERFQHGEEIGTEEQCSACDLLILDDLGTEFHTAYTDAALYSIVNTRMLSDKPTIISTNLTLQELEKTYSERFASRVAGYYAKLEFLGSDVRVELRKRAK